MPHTAQHYYEQGRHLVEDIGRELHLTRWKVACRCSTRPCEVGIVQIRIVHPQARRT